MIVKKILLLSLVGFMLNLFFLHSAVSATPDAEELAAKVKAAIVKLGTGRESQVKVKLRDKTKITGYVSEITEDNFTVIDEKTNSARKIPYPQVKQVNGNNLSKGAVIAITIGFIVAGGILFALVFNK